MKVEQIYTSCLAEAAYYIESNGEAAIIDPLRETDPYIERARADGAKIKYVLETHFHADFVSGHLDLAKKTGATIVYGPTAQPNFKAYIAKDGEELKLGKIKIKVLHTPGHTMESSTYLLLDENGKEYAIFTGDALFLGDVGRPDLAVKTDLTREDLAGHLYDSLHNKIMPLPDDVIVYPGHGAGSACGKKMSKETWGYLGDQKKTNYALQPMSREAFVKEVTEGLVDPPQYFPKNAVMNKMGYDSLDEVIKRGLHPLSVRAFKAAWAEEEALVISPDAKQLSVAAMIEDLNGLLNSHYSVVSDVGDCLYAGLSLRTDIFIAPGYYSSMGFGVPAGIGAYLADPDRRPIILVGDGGFQMTGMEMSTAVKLGINPIIIVFNNASYAMLKFIDQQRDYYDLARWDYAGLAKAVGGDGIQATTREEFKKALDIARDSKGLFLIDAVISSEDISPTLKRLTDHFGAKVRAALAS